MRRLTIALTLILLPTAHAWAEQPSAAVEQTAEAAAPKDKQSDQFQQVIDNTAQTDEQLIAQTKSTASTVKQAWVSQTATEIALALSSLLFLILSFVRRVYKDRLHGHTVRLVCISTGALAALLGYYGGGFGLMEAIQLFMGGVGAIAINESLKVAKKQ
jgi:VIT1/CCC1 family predicted Fe2+/Mn2+ transporter